MSTIRYAVGLDIGSTNIRCLVCVLQDGMMRYLGHAIRESAGWVKGRLSDQLAATEAIREGCDEETATFCGFWPIESSH